MVQEDNSSIADKRHNEIVEKLEDNTVELRSLNNHLVAIMANKVPEGYLPLDVHRQAMEQQNAIHRENVKSLNRSWTWILLAALAVVKFAPTVEQAVVGMAKELPVKVASAESVASAGDASQ